MNHKKLIKKIGIISAKVVGLILLWILSVNSVVAIIFLFLFYGYKINAFFGIM